MSHKPFSEDDGTRRHRIRPDDIDPDAIRDTFVRSETEQTAAAIVRYCQEKGKWVTFTEGELLLFMRRWGRFESDLLWRHNATRGDGRIEFTDAYILEIDGRYYVTHEFICRCFGAAPRDKQYQLG